MATVKPASLAREGPRRRRWWGVLVALVLAVALGVVLFGHRLQAQAVLATSYGARIACTCHYIAGRGLSDCRRDFEPGMALVMLSDSPETRTITARVPLIASQTATLRAGSGCLLQNWGR